MLQEYLRGGDQTSGFMYPRFGLLFKFDQSSSFEVILLFIYNCSYCIILNILKYPNRLLLCYGEFSVFFSLCKSMYCHHIL